jgi:DNA-binding MarR family transcriptional regulator
MTNTQEEIERLLKRESMLKVLFKIGEQEENKAKKNRNYGQALSVDLGMYPSTVYFHTQTLLKLGLIQEVKSDGVEKIYVLTDNGKAIIEPVKKELKKREDEKKRLAENKVKECK